MDGRRSVRVDNLSKLTHIEELRERLVEHFQAEPERQRLFYRGKQVWVWRVDEDTGVWLVVGSALGSQGQMSG